ncbi:MAG: hypothetical protein WA009_09270 [Phototrophicaceae bacterium]|nr:hypothetical protein [Chloroflexota bacterium]
MSQLRFYFDESVPLAGMLLAAAKPARSSGEDVTLMNDSRR